MPGEFQQLALKGARSWRLGEPADIAAMVAFLCSDEAQWITGQVLGVNGGAVL
jgi:NAD(P)-dependent dehydrogenase (short-subunit alcohol dehydrogenase family)